jgi:uncharacterized Zn-finger protein
MEKYENKVKYIEISYQDLPLRCPMPNMISWNSHPKVYLEIEKTNDKRIICPYCSTNYVLIENK